ncbi:hydrogenase expression/formation protein HypE [Clostridium homopropionicum DSM 5847]|uniref:Hydrogenase expression/formation protein HypE n=1 Tax=Clostridium homopropionicum DSM 5847 TaxID=1121318 RepID=A0A0L6Z628_9CLOT|nr:AIR synthase family protein [Clostridium homopropionicum]KOA18253.1 hydrogenase expression/formation protein HypE [Clostridium homopropionicum DSM 5847]SFF70430.1 Hydrogenase maturation protein, carbamoyl dehydratase HypE [Clostridium homopropionicum]
MKIGKLSWDDLSKIIDNNKGNLRDEVRIRSGIGEDCSVVSFGEYECVLSTDPITAADNNIGRLVVHINANDIASCGAEPIGILVTVLSPPCSQLEDIYNVMREINEEAKKLNMEILGGHTEVTDSVNKIVVSCTVIGKAKAGKAVATSGAKAKDHIIVTKKLCLEGTAILINDYYDLVKGVLTDKEIKEAKAYVDSLSVVAEGKIAGEFGVNSMHDITEGGVLGALWEVAKGSSLGFKIYKDRLPISEITVKLCDLFNIDPLKFISSGSMIITCSDGYALVDKLKNSGIEATVIGEVIQGAKILVDNNNEFNVLPPERDELFNISTENIIKNLQNRR